MASFKFIKEKPKKSSKKKKSENESWILEGIVDFLESPTWTVPVINFVESNCEEFDNAEENKFIYTDIHKKYASLVEGLLQKYTDELGISATQFSQACERNEATLKYLDGMFEFIWAADDFILFKQLMLKRNIQIEKEALNFVQMEYEIDDETTEQEYTRLVEFAMRKSKAEFEHKDFDATQDEENLRYALHFSKMEMERLNLIAEEERKMMEKAISMSLAEQNSAGKNKTSSKPNTLTQNNTNSNSSILQQPLPVHELKVPDTGETISPTKTPSMPQVISDAVKPTGGRTSAVETVDSEVNTSSIITSKLLSTEPIIDDLKLPPKDNTSPKLLHNTTSFRIPATSRDPSVDSGAGKTSVQEQTPISVVSDNACNSQFKHEEEVLSSELTNTESIHTPKTDSSLNVGHADYIKPECNDDNIDTNPQLNNKTVVEAVEVSISSDEKDRDASDSENSTQNIPIDIVHHDQTSPGNGVLPQSKPVTESPKNPESVPQESVKLDQQSNGAAPHPTKPPAPSAKENRSSHPLKKTEKLLSLEKTYDLPPVKQPVQKSNAEAAQEWMNKAVEEITEDSRKKAGIQETKKPSVDSEALAKRKEYLKNQREKLLEFKRKEREKELSKYNRLMGEIQDQDDPLTPPEEEAKVFDPAASKEKKVNARRALAAKLRREVVNRR